MGVSKVISDNNAFETGFLQVVEVSVVYSHLGDQRERQVDRTLDCPSLGNHQTALTDQGTTPHWSEIGAAHSYDQSQSV